MTTTPESPGAPAPQNLVARFIGVIVSPQATFKGVVAHPKWFGMLALITLFLAATTTAFLVTEVGQDALLDQQIASMETFGIEVSDAQIDQMEQGIGMAAYFGGVTQLVAIPLVYVVMAGILFAIFNAAMGGTATFKQLFAVLAHSGAVSVVQQLFVMPLNYMRGSMESATNLAALLPILPETGFLTYLLGAVDVFIIWWLIVLAIGLGVLYKRRTQSTATTLFVVYGIIALVIATVRTFMGGS